MSTDVPLTPLLADVEQPPFWAHIKEEIDTDIEFLKCLEPLKRASDLLWLNPRRSQFNQFRFSLFRSS